MRKSAPLVIFVYNRPNLTVKMLEKINEDVLAKETCLYIYSDGSRIENDVEKVKKVREHIHQFSLNSNFKEVHIIEAERNRGLAASIIHGASEIIKKYGRIIVLEDDLLVSPVFLSFMNDCLDFYENDPRIWSIGGTTYDLPALEKYQKDVYVSYRAESCGWATWIDRWNKVDWEVKDFQEFLCDRKRKKQFNRGGQDMVESLRAQIEGKTDSWAIRWCYQQSKEDMLTILPVVTLVENIGWDGSGVHCGEVNVFPVRKGKGVFQYTLERVDIDPQLIKDFRNFFSRSWYQRIIDRIYLMIKGNK